MPWRAAAFARAALLAMALLAAQSFASQAFAEAPLAVGAPKAARGRILVAAAAFEGVPYRYGGSDRAGMDCSGLVYIVYREAVSISVPRTVKTLYLFCEPIQRNELQIGDLVFFDTDGPLAHVGIYAGEGRFIHAASEGQTRGVMESSLSEPTWTRTYAGAGRLIPPAEYLGLVFSAALAPELGSGPLLRGVSASAGLGTRIIGLEVGIEARPEYDAALGVLRLPAVLSVSVGKDLRFFAGPALTLGSPTLGSGSDARSYRAEGGLLATAGVVWTPLRFTLAGRDAGLFGQLVYNRYVPKAGGATDPGAVVSAGLGLSFRWGF